MGILALVVIAGCAFWLFYYQKSQPVPGEPVPHMMPLVCDACGEAYADEAGALPTVCAKCGEKKAYYGLMCTECGKITPFYDYGKPSSGGRKVKCKYCDGTKLREVKAGEVSKP
ncbi:MAG: hypothetical protein D6744_12475 [Planctomycetota bacterium]|nr:MAG: hypothetical protein D6744_12475 [Planctomycetota bacterium]